MTDKPKSISEIALEQRSAEAEIQAEAITVEVADNCLICLFEYQSKARTPTHMCAPPGLSPVEVIDPHHGMCIAFKKKHEWL